MSEALKKRWKDPEWKYVPKDSSDIRKTFERIREASAKRSSVTPMKRKGQQ